MKKPPFNQVIVFDCETAWCSKSGYTLSKLTVEEYVRSEKFRLWGLAWKYLGEDGPAIWVRGSQVKDWCASFDWSQTATVAHNAQFDNFILSHHFGVHPCFIFDSLSMGRALRGIEKGNSLRRLAEMFGLPPKGQAVYSTDGILDRLPFETELELAEYCKHDVFLCESIFSCFMQGFSGVGDAAKVYSGRYPTKELELISMTLKMFCNPVLELDTELLRSEVYAEKIRRETLLTKLGVTDDVLASSEQFAGLLLSLGYEPPTKLSPNVAGRTIYAFAKTDALFQQMLHGEDEILSQLCEARLAVKSTLERTRGQRLLDISYRGALPVPLRYYAAHTGRWGGDGSINLQNLGRKSFLRDAMHAPKGYVLVVADLRQIEPRVLAWLAGYLRVLEIFASGRDVYASFGETMFNIPGMTQDTHPVERQSAKAGLLGCGYGMGWAKLATQLLTGFLGAPPVLYGKSVAKTLGVTADDVDSFYSNPLYALRMGDIPHTCTDAELIIHCIAAKQIVDKYRAAAQPVVDFWRLCDDLLLKCLVGGKEIQHKILTFKEGEIVLPNGMTMRYPDLNGKPDEQGRVQWTYGANKKLHGPKIVENCIAEGTLVLTQCGWVPIEQITIQHKVYDGCSFVHHGGKILKSVQTCVMVDGVYMTPDHEVLTDAGWEKASQFPQPYRPNIRAVNSATSITHRWKKMALGISMRVRKVLHKNRNKGDSGTKPSRVAKLWLRVQTLSGREKYHARYEQASGICSLARDVRPVQTIFAPCMEELRWSGHYSVHTLGTIFSKFLGRYGKHVPAWTYSGANEQQCWIQQRKLYMGSSCSTSIKSPQQPACKRSGIVYTNGDIYVNFILQAKSWLAHIRSWQNPESKKQVYDIINAGVLNRFVVLGATGPFIVHNCTQAVARIVMTDGLLRVQRRYPILHTAHDEGTVLVPEQEADEAKAWIYQQMTEVPAWMPGIPLDASVGVGHTYREAKK